MQLRFPCAAIVAFVASSGLAFAGPFTFSGQTTADTFDATYRQTTRPTIDQSIQASEQTSDVTESTSVASYRQSTKPTADASSRVSDAASETSAASGRQTVAITIHQHHLAAFVDSCFQCHRGHFKGLERCCRGIPRRD